MLQNWLSIIEYKVQHRTLDRDQTALLEQTDQEFHLMDQEYLQELEGQEEEVSQDGIVVTLDLMVRK